MDNQLNIKVCGITQAQDLQALVKYGVNYAGFIFYERSPRFAGNKLDARTVRETTGIKKVGVFVDADLQLVKRTIADYSLDMVQLHGNESPAYCAELQQLVPVIKVFRIGSQVNWQELAPYVPVSSYFLFDTAAAHAYGGTGLQFDWQVLLDYPFQQPFFLSGGIGPEHAAELTRLQLPFMYAVDVNSRFEKAPGIKVLQHVQQFVKEIHSTDIKQQRMKIAVNTKGSRYHVDENGYYGQFGGAYIPEMLYPNVEELRQHYMQIMADPAFQQQFTQLLKDYVGRPSPLYLAQRLSEKYKAKIYLKREDLNHTGAHKINNTIGQILLAQRLGKKRIIAETGAGQHGVATATVCALMGIECVVYMGSVDIERQAPNVARMKMLGATVIPATSGSRTLKDATNEAIRDWINNPVDTHYIIGSVVGPHPYPDMVARFQSVISEEIKQQLLEKTGKASPDYVLACVGGGSNAAGAFFHFLDDEKVQLIPVEAAGKGVNSGYSAATSQLGKPGVIHASKTLLMQTEDGQIVEPHSISAGLDYPGVGPLHAHLFDTGRARFMSATDDEALEAAFELTRLEGIIPALESSHALARLKDLSLKPDDVVVVCLSGRGDKDMATYINHLK